MSSIDLKKVHKEHYTASNEPGLVDVPPRPCLMIEGEGDPNTSQAYADAVAALYPLAYGLRIEIKKQTGTAYTVMPLEGLWWVEPGEAFSFEDRGNWRWIAMICQPDEATDVLASEVIPRIIAKKSLAAGDRVRLQRFGDGLAVQVLHVGPYAEEQPTIDRLHQYIQAEGFGFRGRHHEIYLSDPRKTPSNKVKTIIRQPVDADGK